MNEIIKLLKDKNIKYIYNKKDKVLTISSIEISLTTKGNFKLYKLADNDEFQYLNTLNKEQIKNALCLN